MTAANDEAFYRYYADESLKASTLERFTATPAAVVRAARHFGLEQRPWDLADIGCGAATQCALWARAGHRVFGVDINEPLIELGRERAKAAGLQIDLRSGTATELPWSDESMDVCLCPELLEHVVRDAEASVLDRVVVVVPSLLPPPIVGRAEVAENVDATAGCSSSLHAGLDRAGACEAVLLLLGDMPGVGPDLIDDVVARWRATPSWAAVTSYVDGIGHPFVFSAGAFEGLRGLHGDKAIWKIVERESPARVVRIAVERARPRDVDTWADFVAVCADFGVPPAGAEASGRG